MPFIVDYSPPERNLCLSRSSSLHWDISVPDLDMRDRSEFLMRLDSVLDCDTVASMVAERFGNFSCKFCFSPLISDGKNLSGSAIRKHGYGTVSLRNHGLTGRMDRGVALTHSPA